jgi:predicted PurR-regulated permease PerM
MIAFILSFIAGLGLYLGISLVQQLKSLNKSITEMVLQEGELIKLTAKNTEVLSQNQLRGEELHELQKQRLMLELSAIQKMVEKKPSTVNDQITDAVTQTKPKTKK